MSAQQPTANGLADLFALDSRAGSYSCALCHGVHRFGPRLEAAETEFDARFPGQDIEDSAIVCDPCYRALGLGTH